MKLKTNLLLPLALVGAASPLVAKERPNVIFILADDLGYGDLSCYNADGKIQTANLDQMAKSGVMFTDAHTSSSVSTPTRYGVLTGRYNWRSTLKTGVLSGYSKSLISPERTTVAEVMKHSGYSTAVIGKWHLGWDWDITAPDPKGLHLDELNARPTVDFSTKVEISPIDHGFDYYYAFCGSLDMPPYVWVENDHVTESPSKKTQNSGIKFWRNGLTSDDFHHEEILQDVADKAIEYIDEQANEKSPFFVYLPLPAPHTPILPSEAFQGKSQTNSYGDYVMQVDDLVGQIRTKLEELGISDNTMLIFTSDNGCSPSARIPDLNELGHYPNGVLRGTKADLYEGGHRVPYIVEWADGAKSNIAVDKTICTTDLFATLAEITGYKIADSEGEDSYSIVPYIKGKKSKSPRKYTVHHSVNGGFAIRSGEWKMIFSKGSGGWTYPTDAEIEKKGLVLPDFQLFNLKDDIGEKNNLIESYPEKANELLAAMKMIITDGRSTPGAAQKNENEDKWPQIEVIFDAEEF